MAPVPVLEVAGVRLSHADRVVYPELGRTKLRFCFCKKDETLNAAAERLAKL